MAQLQPGHRRADRLSGLEGLMTETQGETAT